jgi:hypothetical protein
MANISPLSPISPQTQAHSQNISHQDSKQKTNPVSIVEPSKNLVVDAQANSTASEQQMHRPDSSRSASIVATIAEKINIVASSSYKTLVDWYNTSTKQVPTDLQLKPITIIDNNADNSLQNILNLDYSASTITLDNKKIKQLLAKLELELNCLKRLFSDDVSLCVTEYLEVFLPARNIEQIKKVASIYKKLQSFLISQDADKYLYAKKICKDVEECFNLHRHNICMSLITHLDSRYNINEILNIDNTVIEHALINILQTITLEIKNSNKYSEHYLTKWFNNEKLDVLKNRLDKTSTFMLEKSFYSSTVVISLYYLIGCHEEAIQLIKNKALNFEKETIVDLVYSNCITDTIDNFVSFLNYNIEHLKIIKYLEITPEKNNKKSFLLNSSAILISLKQVAEQVFSYWFTGSKEENDNPDAILNYIAKYYSDGTTKDYTEVCSPIINKLLYEFSMFNKQLYIMLTANSFRAIHNYKYINFLLYRVNIDKLLDGELQDDELPKVVNKIKKHLNHLHYYGTGKENFILNRQQAIKLLDGCCKTKTNLQDIDKKLASALFAIDKSCKKSMAMLCYDEKKFIDCICEKFRVLNREAQQLIESDNEITNDKDSNHIEIILDHSLHNNSEKNIFAVNTSAISFKKKQTSENIDIETIKEYCKKVKNELAVFAIEGLNVIKIETDNNIIKYYISENDIDKIKKFQHYATFLRHNLEKTTKKFLLQNDGGNLIELHGLLLLAILEKNLLVYENTYNNLLLESTVEINAFNAHKSKIISIINDYSAIREQSNIRTSYSKVLPYIFYNSLIIKEIIQLKQSPNEINSFLYTLRNNHYFKDVAEKSIKKLTESLFTEEYQYISFLQEIITYHILIGNYDEALNISQKYMRKTKDTSYDYKSSNVQNKNNLTAYMIRLNSIVKYTLETIELKSATNKNKILGILKANKEILENISNYQCKTQSDFKLLQNKIDQLQLDVAKKEKTAKKIKAQTEKSKKSVIATSKQRDSSNFTKEKSDIPNDQKQSEITIFTEPKQQQQKKQFPTDEDIFFPIDTQLNYLVVDNHDTAPKKSNKKISNKRKSILNKKDDDKRTTNNSSISKDIILEPVITDTIQIGNSTETKATKLKNPENNPIQNILQATPNLSQTILDQLGNQLKASTKINNNEPIPVFNNQEESSYLNKDEDLVNNNISETNSATKKKKKKKKKKKEETVPNVITPATDNAPINSSNHVTKINSDQAIINEFQKVIKCLYEDNIIKSLSGEISLTSSYQDPVALDDINSALLDHIDKETTPITSKVDYLYGFIIKLNKSKQISLQVSKNKLHKLVAELFTVGIDNIDNITLDNTTNNNADIIIKLDVSKKRLITEQQILELCKLSKLEFIDDIDYKITADNLGELRPVTLIQKNSDSTDSSLLDISLFTDYELNPIESRYSNLPKVIKKHPLPEEKNTFSYYMQKCNNYLIDNLNYLDHLLDISNIIVEPDTGRLYLQTAVINQFNKVTKIHNHLKLIVNKYAEHTDLHDPTFVNNLSICIAAENLFLTCQMGFIKIMISDAIKNKQEILSVDKKHFLNICLVCLSRVKSPVATNDTYPLNLSVILDTIINLVGVDFITTYNQKYLVDILAESKIFKDAITKSLIDLCVIPYDYPTIEFSKLSQLKRSASDKPIYHHKYKISDFNNCMRLMTSCLFVHNYLDAEHILDEHIRELEKIIFPSNRVICSETTINIADYISVMKNYLPIIKQYITLVNLSNTNQKAFISFLNKFSKVVLTMRSYDDERKKIYSIKCIMDSFLPINIEQEITEESYYQAVADVKIEQVEFRNDMSQLSITEIKQCLYCIGGIRAMLLDNIKNSNDRRDATIYRNMKIHNLIANKPIVEKYLAKVVGTIFDEDKSIAEDICYINALNRIFKLYYGYLLENYPGVINNKVDLSDAEKITEFQKLCMELTNLVTLDNILK